MIKIYHVSDLHFHHDDAKNQEALALLQRIAKEVSFGPTFQNYLLITGDLVDDGDPEQFARVLQALEPFRGKLIVCPGNHDYGLFGNIYDPTCARYFDDSFLSALDVGYRFFLKQPAITRLVDPDGTRVVLYGLNSVLETPRVDDFARGEIGAAQRRALHEALNDPADDGALRLVYLHHRPQRCSWFLELVDSEELMAVVHNRVAVLAFGHDGRGDEPDQARIMHVRPRQPYGVSYLLNANGAVRSQLYYEIVFSQGDVSVYLR